MCCRTPQLPRVAPPLPCVAPSTGRTPPLRRVPPLRHVRPRPFPSHAPPLRRAGPRSDGGSGEEVTRSYPKLSCRGLPSRRILPVTVTRITALLTPTPWRQIRRGGSRMHHVPMRASLRWRIQPYAGPLFSGGRRLLRPLLTGAVYFGSDAPPSRGRKRSEPTGHPKAGGIRQPRRQI